MNERAELEAKAIADYRAALGTEIETETLSGYKGDDCLSFDGTPFRVRVVETPEDDLKHWVDEYLDPYWNVEIVGDYPQLAGVRSFWTFGKGYQAVAK